MVTAVKVQEKGVKMKSIVILCENITIIIASLTYARFVPPKRTHQRPFSSVTRQTLRSKSRQHQNDVGNLALYHIRIPNCVTAIQQLEKSVRILQWPAHIRIFRSLCHCNVTCKTILKTTAFCLLSILVYHFPF